MKLVHRLSAGFLLLILISSCASNYIPVGGEGLQIIDDAYLLRDDNTELIALSRYWTREPTNLNDYFTTFYVSVKNLSGEKMQIDPTDFALLDQNGNQSDPLSIIQIEDILLNEQLQYLIISNIEETDEDSFVDMPDTDTNSDILEEWRRSKRNLIRDSFTFGDIFPQAKKAGYLFFPKVSIKNDELTLLYRDHSLKFRR